MAPVEVATRHNGEHERRTVEVCLSPGLFGNVLTTGDFTVVLVDILRATTTICTALANGAEAIVPVASHEEARRLKAEGFLVASERDGAQLDFADFGNSAFSFTREAIGGKTLVYCTTNGTRALHIAKGADGAKEADLARHARVAVDRVAAEQAGGGVPGARGVVIGAFVNISPLAAWLVGRDTDVVVLCAGWKDRFCLEDTLFAGALARRLLATGLFRTECDAAHAAMDLWSLAEGDALDYVEKAAQRHRLKKLGLDDVIPYSFELDRVHVVPVFDGYAITAGGPPSGCKGRPAVRL